jgi:hypothetical protein
LEGSRGDGDRHGRHKRKAELIAMRHAHRKGDDAEGRDFLHREQKEVSRKGNESQAYAHDADERGVPDDRLRVEEGQKIRRR